MPSDSDSRARSSHGSSQRLGETVLDDLTRPDFSQSVQQDLQDVYRYYLDDATRRELDAMGPAQRNVFMVSWLLRNSILKLAPARRLLLLASVFVFALGLVDAVNVLLLCTGFVALLFVLLFELKDRLLAQDELETGRAVQFALMPDAQPDIEGWDAWVFTRPANEVGGDLVDHLLTGERRVGIALGDVAGKGLGAALLMAKLQSVVRALAPNQPELGPFGTLLNATMRRDGLPNRFISLVYLELEPNRPEVRFVNAGHLPPMWLAGGEVRSCSKGGAALGLLPDAQYDEERLTLSPGDYLLLYSDGLTEARDLHGQFFGTDRLSDLFSDLGDMTAHEVGVYLRTALDRFTGDAPYHDDLSLVVLRYTGPGTETQALPPISSSTRIGTSETE